MDLPPDKAKLLRSYDNEKKWEIICDQDMVQAKDSPAHYLNKLKTYLDPKASRSHRVSTYLVQHEQGKGWVQASPILSLANSLQSTCIVVLHSI